VVILPSSTFLYVHAANISDERVDMEGKVATANTYSILLSNLPQSGRPNRLMMYDIHALQNRFYFHGATIPSLHTTVPLLLDKLSMTSTRTIAFPDEGAAKRLTYALLYLPE